MDKERAFHAALEDAKATFTALRDQLAELSEVKAEDRALRVHAVLANYKDLAGQLNKLADVVEIERRVKIELQKYER